MKKFCTSINCMDGRVQLPVINYLTNYFDIDYVDSITEPGPNLILANQTDPSQVNSILSRISISVEKHSSSGIAISGHHDCAGNPATEEKQKQHIISSIKFLSSQFKNIPTVGLWIDQNWEVSKVSLD